MKAGFVNIKTTINIENIHETRLRLVTQ
jgi:hypothetical protein